jgi:hypothetical protein
MTRTPLAAVVLGAALAVAAPSAEGASSPELVVQSPSDLEPTAAEVRRIGRGDFSSTLVLAGLSDFGSPIRVVLEPERGSVASRTPGWVSGFADAATGTIVLFPHRVSSYPDDNLRTLVHHEVAHVVVGRAARGHPVPRWFDEGIATVAAREWGIEDRARYALAVVGRGPRTVAELDAGFAAGGRRVTRSYALSGAFVRWLRMEYGEHVTGGILERLSRGIRFEEAFVRTTGDPIQLAEHRFFVREALWHTWVPFLTSSGALWAAITVLALVAIRRRRAKSAAMKERWDAEEELVRLQESPRSGLRTDFGRTPTPDEADDDVVN